MLEKLLKEREELLEQGRNCEILNAKIREFQKK